MSFYLPRANDRRVPTVERIIARLGKTRMNLVDEVSIIQTIKLSMWF